MAVELSPVEEVDIDEAVLALVEEAYCANCTHVTTQETDTAYCTRWGEPTRIKPGWICLEYHPQGLEPR